jgi:uncharacterized lipoprotein YddW (UPF0748 family)
VEAAPKFASKKLTIDLHNVTFADRDGKQVLRAIYAQTHARLIATTPWAQFLAQEVTTSKTENVEEGE